MSKFIMENFLIVYEYRECTCLYFFQTDDEETKIRLRDCHGKYLSEIYRNQFLENLPTLGKKLYDSSDYREQSIPLVDDCRIIVTGDCLS